MVQDPKTYPQRCQDCEDFNECDGKEARKEAMDELKDIVSPNGEEFDLRTLFQSFIQATATDRKVDKDLVFHTEIVPLLEALENKLEEHNMPSVIAIQVSNQGYRVSDSLRKYPMQDVAMDLISANLLLRAGTLPATALMEYSQTKPRKAVVEEDSFIKGVFEKDRLVMESLTKDKSFLEELLKYSQELAAKPQ